MPDINQLPWTSPPYHDDDGSDSDVESVRSEDFEGYFEERFGRRFHSHGIYPLPVDDREVDVCFQVVLMPKRGFNQGLQARDEPPSYGCQKASWW